tara:strand:+ start:1615 stop:2025 length:411 start_codon:yes stop_codon:yes gene_type:complete
MKDFIEKECLKNPREESCGFLIFSKRRVRIRPCSNIDENKDSHFRISIKDYIRFSKEGELFGVYHSHTNALPDFSRRDIIHSEEMMVPYLVYSIKHDAHNVYIPKKTKNGSKSFYNFLYRLKKEYGVNRIKERVEK